jgi:hypothetical protein
MLMKIVTSFFLYLLGLLGEIILDRHAKARRPSAVTSCSELI